jgi:UDP-N-acetyl-D-glucosamine dehydrogenase
MNGSVRGASVMNRTLPATPRYPRTPLTGRSHERVTLGFAACAVSFYIVVYVVSIGVIGLGYVGLPLVVEFAEKGEEIVAVDLDARKVSALNAGESYVEDISSERLRGVLDRVQAGTYYAPLARTDTIIICVPTPLTANREPELGPLLDSGEAVAQVLQRGQLVVLESTTYPGTTREMLVPLLEAGSGLRVGEDLNVAFSPERVDPGNKTYTLSNTPKVVGGITDRCTDRAVELYEKVCDRIVRVSSPEAAELTKLLENIFRSVNIALVNEMAILAGRMGIDIWEVVDAASTKPHGFMRFEPGPGMGGHCLPIDPFYLTWRAREFHMSTEFIELAGKINQYMPTHCVVQIERALNEHEKPVKGSRIMLLGVSYKGGIGDMRESPALRIIEELSERGGTVSYHDPFVPELPRYGLSSIGLDGAVAEADAVVLVTAHPGIDHHAIARDASLFVDLRGVTRGVQSENIARL